MEKEEGHINGGNEGRFGLPGGYFGDSAKRIAEKIGWLEELKPYPALLVTGNVSGFTVPENYFGKLENELELLPFGLLSEKIKHLGFGAPDGYFDNTVSRVSSRLEYLSELSDYPQLSVLRNEEGFEVEQNYFAGNERKLTELLSEPKQAKVFRLFTGRQLSLAAAATVVLFTSIWIFRFYYTQDENDDCGTIACLDKKEIFNSGSLESMNKEDLFELADPYLLMESMGETEMPDELNYPDTNSGMPDEI